MLCPPSPPLPINFKFLNILNFQGLTWQWIDFENPVNYEP